MPDSPIRLLCSGVCIANVISQCLGYNSLLFFSQECPQTLLGVTRRLFVRSYEACISKRPKAKRIRKNACTVSSSRASICLWRRISLGLTPDRDASCWQTSGFGALRTATHATHGDGRGDGATTVWCAGATAPRKSLVSIATCCQEKTATVTSLGFKCGSFRKSNFSYTGTFWSLLLMTRRLEQGVAALVGCGWVRVCVAVCVARVRCK